MKYSNRILMMALVAFGFVLGGCDKTKLYDVTIPPPEAHFVGAKTQLYDASVDPTPVKTITVGTTDVASADRTVTYKVTSMTAVAGTHYTIATGNTTGTITIKGGEALADIEIQAIHAQYGSPRKDTVLITLEEPSMKPAGFQDTVRLVITGPSVCSEASPDLAGMLGAYDNTNETFAGGPYGPYSTNIASATSTGPTTANIVVENVWDNGWGPLTFTLDWTDPLNLKTSVVENDAIPGSDAGDINPAYAGMTIAIRQNAAIGLGTYATCGIAPTFTFNCQLGVTGLGWFNATTALYRVILNR